ncbi:MAG: amidohydrolase family protein [Gammaproteobacteria bacterium]|nr:amidohydrolase family protein [Gammaproteobacteria bacterium]
MHDLVIRGATLIDGTGAARQVTDVAVDQGVFSAVGSKLGSARREITADGLLLTPGWVDIHTHYDGQATWDPYMTPSSWHGVTTAVFGNCSVGFAPVRPGSEPYLINLMEGVEDIPETVLWEGIKFNWESFPDYMNVLESTPRIMDIGAQVPHGALRFYVMGDRGADHKEAPTADEISQMGALLEESLRAGALGFTTSRTTKHRAADGSPTPGLSAEEPELAGLAMAMKRAGAGVMEVNSDFGEGDFARLRAAAEISGRPLSVLLVQVDNAPQLWRETLDAVGQACDDGLDVTAQVGSRPIGMLMGLNVTIHPFVTHPAWAELEALAPADRIRRLKDNAQLRRCLVDERPDDDHTRWMSRVLQRSFELNEPVNYEPAPELSIANLAAAEGRDPFEYALDLMLQDDGSNLILHPFENYCSGDLEVVKEMLLDDHSVCGVADAGAHVGLICDASSPTSLLTHWGRDRMRGERLPLEFLVRKQTHDTARTYGLDDRGVIAPGYKADFNLIDFDALRLERPEVVYDLPAGGRRIVQKAQGYRHTFVSGVEVMTDGVATGELPGKLLRGAQTRAD